MLTSCTILAGCRFWHDLEMQSRIRLNQSCRRSKRVRSCCSTTWRAYTNHKSDQTIWRVRNWTQHPLAQTYLERAEHQSLENIFLWSHVTEMKWKITANTRNQKLQYICEHCGALPYNYVSIPRYSSLELQLSSHLQSVEYTSATRSVRLTSPLSLKFMFSRLTVSGCSFWTNTERRAQLQANCSFFT